MARLVDEVGSGAADVLAVMFYRMSPPLMIHRGVGVIGLIGWVSCCRTIRPLFQRLGLKLP
jgi:hypothetical protein